MIRKLTLAIVTCPTSSILIQNHSAFHEYFANKRQIKASLSLEIVKKTSRDRMQLPKNVSRPKKVCDRMLLCSTLLRNLGRFPRILTSVSILIVHVLLYEEPIKLEIEIPLSQSFSRRPTADKEPEKLWARDWARGGRSKMVGKNGHRISLARLSVHGTRHAFGETAQARGQRHQSFGQNCQTVRH